MFICSLKASSLRFLGVILLSAAALVSLIALIPEYEPTASDTVYASASVTYSGIRTNADRISFLSQFGWQVAESPLYEVQVKIPDNFDCIFVRYNNLQKLQGLDLGKYRRRTVTRYTYQILNYPDYEGLVYANLLVYRGKIVGGDICTADSDGFVRGLDGVKVP